jgi:hypothetical protein
MAEDMGYELLDELGLALEPEDAAMISVESEGDAAAGMAACGWQRCDGAGGV